jgi:GTP-binding protein
LFKSIETVKKGAQTRLGTGVLNRILHGAIDNNPGPLGSAGKHSFKLLYATQVNHTEEEAVPVPHFVLFANRAFKLQDSYLRFLESKIREEFPGEGLPFVLKVKGKAKR